MTIYETIRKSRATRWRRPQDAPRIGKNPLIFSSPELQHLGVRALWHFSSAAMWSLIFYLLKPLITISTWIISFTLGYVQLVANDVYLETISQLQLYGSIICIIAIIIGVKLIFNVLTENINFRKNSKVVETKPSNNINYQHVAHINDKLSKFVVESDFKRMIAHHDDHGHLIGVDRMAVSTSVAEPEKQPS